MFCFFLQDGYKKSKGDLPQKGKENTFGRKEFILIECERARLVVLFGVWGGGRLFRWQAEYIHPER